MQTGLRGHGTRIATGQLNRETQPPAKRVERLSHKHPQSDKAAYRPDGVKGYGVESSSTQRSRESRGESEYHDPRTEFHQHLHSAQERAEEDDCSDPPFRHPRR